MKNFQFPIKLSFKIITLSNEITATDASGKIIAYVKQKLFKLKEDVSVYEDATKSRLNFKIKADKWLDFNAAYAMTDASGANIGRIVRKGWRSFWKSEYELVDQFNKLQYHIREENPWVKVMDGLLSEIPVLGLLSGYFFNPSYMLTSLNGEETVRLTKRYSLFGSEFELSELNTIDQDDAERIMLGFMMMVLLERRRG